MSFIKDVLNRFRSLDDARNPQSIWYMNTQLWIGAEATGDAPPWLVFPNTREPMLVPSTQGNNEVYWQLWWEFWGALTDEAKLSYLRERQAPPVWRAYLEPGGERDQFFEDLGDAL